MERALSLLRKVFKRGPKLPAATGKVWSLHHQWGNAFSLFDWDRRMYYGFKRSDKPVVGDEIHQPMKSGKTAVLRITSVDYKLDPPDMFFCEAQEIGYLGEEDDKVETKFVATEEEADKLKPNKKRKTRLDKYAKKV